jgi:glycosyltransferase involved in cell wall biosynthesis
LPSTDTYQILVIKEGIDSTSGGLGTWFHSMAIKFKAEGKSVMVFSLDPNSKTDFQSVDISFARPPAPVRWLASMFRLSIARKVFAKHELDAEFVVDKIFGISANFFIQWNFRNILGQTKISTPLYAGIGSYLSKKLNVEIGLVSSTEDALNGMALTERRYKRKYLPKIKKERLSLEKHKSRVAVSKDIFHRYGLEDKNPLYRIDTPRVLDKLHGPLSNLTSKRVVEFEDREDILLFIGRCENRKGFDLLLEIWKRIQIEIPSFKLVLIGDDFETQSNASVGIDKIICLGFVNSLHKSELLAKAKFVIIPSRYESFGIVTIESLSFGTPVIVSRVGGLRNISEESCSVLKCEVGDIDSFVLQILECLNDITTWKSISSRSREDFLARYSLSNILSHN